MGRIPTPVLLVLGVSLLIVVILSWQAPQQERNAKIAEINSIANNLVSECMRTLPQGRSYCDEQLRQSIAEACESTDGKLDACHDGRVERYYSTVAANKASLPTTQNQIPVIAPETTQTVITEGPFLGTNEPQPDWRCFDHYVTMIDVDSFHYYTVNLYTELNRSSCDREDNPLTYYPQLLDLNRIHADIEDIGGGLTRTYYTEYRLLNGTVLSFGEKEIVEDTDSFAAQMQKIREK